MIFQFDMDISLIENKVYIGWRNRIKSLYPFNNLLNEIAILES